MPEMSAIRVTALEDPQPRYMNGRYRIKRYELCPVCRTHEAPVFRDGDQVFCSLFCKVRAANLRRLYGITPERFWKMWEEQDGTCAMPGCTAKLHYKAHQRRRTQGVMVDHDAETGTVRGLLCPTCNRNLGGYERIIKLDVESYLAAYAVPLN